MKKDDIETSVPFEEHAVSKGGRTTRLNELMTYYMEIEIENDEVSEVDERLQEKASDYDDRISIKRIANTMSKEHFVHPDKPDTAYDSHPFN